MPDASSRPARRREVRRDPRVLKAYLGGGEMRARPRATPLAAARATPILDCRRSSRAGYGAAPVLDEISFEVRPGEMVALLGANGAGKSTAMRAVTGLLRPVAGAIVLDDERDRAARGASHRRAAASRWCRKAGRCFPSSACATTSCSAPTRAATSTATPRSRRCSSAFRACASASHSRAGLLSGGEQQMLAIARGLMAKPRILLLDEPSLGLAPAMINELFDVLAELRDDGVTILLVDQMAALALTVADRGYVLESGRIVRDDSAAALARDPALEAAYLGRVQRAP